MIFDVLEAFGKSTMALSYWQRRRIVDRLNLNGHSWRTPDTFDDGEGLFESVRIAGLEGLLAKKLSMRYRPGKRLWLKVKNRDYWRFPLEREAAMRRGGRSEL